jgi:hypothetical protein
MKGGWRFQPLQHLGGEKSSQTNEEKNHSTTLGLSRHGGEELELAGEYGEWLGWQEEEGGTGVIWMSAFSLGWCYELRLKGYPLVSARNTSRD